MTPKNLRTGQNGQFGRWNRETAIQQPQLRLDRRRQFALQFVEALPLGLVVEEDDRAPARLVPLGDLLRKKLPPRLMQHEIRRIENAERILMNGRREVFEPFDLRRAAEDAHAGWKACITLDLDDEIVRAEMAANASTFIGAIVHRQNDASAVETADGRLIMQIEGADGLQFVVKKLQAQRFLRLPGEKVHDAAATRKLTALGDDGHTLVTGLRQLFEQDFDIQLLADFEHAFLLGDLLQIRCGFVETVRAEHHHGRITLQHATQHGRARRRPLRVRERPFDDVAETRKIQRRALPHAELGMHMVLRLHIRAENPNAAFFLLHAPHEQRRRKAKGLRRDVIEHRARLELLFREHQIDKAECIPPRTAGGRFGQT